LAFDFLFKLKMTAIFAKSFAQIDGLIAKLETELGEPKKQHTEVTPSSSSSLSASTSAATTPQPQESSSSGEAAKSKHSAKKKPPPSAQQPEELFSKVHLQIGQLETCTNHPDATSLFVCKVNLGTEQRQLVTGLVGHYTAEQLTNKLVVVITNLRPSKLRGVESSAMLLAADDSLTTKQNHIVILEPPAGASVGDRVYLEGSSPTAEIPPRLPPKQWEKVVSGLFVKDGKATFKDVPLVTKDGPVTVPGIADGSGIH
jgi:methionine--tRNA ligase beta chain